jgi:hypothetical protein
MVGVGSPEKRFLRGTAPKNEPQMSKPGGLINSPAIKFWTGKKRNISVKPRELGFLDYLGDPWNFR